jgi:hypothetical protein
MASSLKMDKKVPQNPRFANVQSRLDTGRTAAKVKHLSARQYLKRKDEVKLLLRFNLFCTGLIQCLTCFMYSLSSESLRSSSLNSSKNTIAPIVVGGFVLNYIK